MMRRCAEFDGGPDPRRRRGATRCRGAVMILMLFAMVLAVFAIVYIGVPVLLVLLIGVAEALLNRNAARVAVFALLGFAAAMMTVQLAVGVPLERLVLAVPVLMAISGFGWAQLTRQFASPATQVTVSLAVASIAMAGVAWNQSVFNPQTQFTEEMAALKEYALSLDHGAGLTDDDTRGLKAIAQVLRDEAIASIAEVPGTRSLWLALAKGAQPSPNRWMDAYLAALAITHDVEMVTFDRGFVDYENSGLKLSLLEA